MTLDLERLDPFDDHAVDAWWDAYAAAERADRGATAPVWTREEMRSEFQQDSRIVERRAFLLRAEGAVVGSAGLALPAKDNTHAAHVSVFVPPPHRRRGHGSAALVQLEQQARDAGRTVAKGRTSWPFPLGTDGLGTPGREFARRHGYALALGDVQSRLALPVAGDHLDRIDDDVRPSTSAYTLRSWIGPVPEDVVEGWAVLDAAIDTEAPTGDLDVEHTRPDVASVRELEELHARQRRTSFGTIALTADGHVAAYSQLVVSADDGNAYQWGTLVRREDRGHRLGTAVKIANLRLLHDALPQTRAVITYNAESNAAMIAVNTRLGFVPSERMGELQRHLARGGAE
ncbi:GNAT family N-acetyltransferase [Microbacterium sp. p3-SID336]|uniref:GNAT family N-acetyltransferase n=1 Tax=Microbacterium sp. p3-SID336 TaxID=2916212 RepID=UPI0021A72368|nr:GNAT family N-acetyltransferase [Microbacterium sp. p3-SID336]MCT1476654.1 GNAT family N-acetyltransferase [Microbacterium sp. p3-SID336]